MQAVIVKKWAGCRGSGQARARVVVRYGTGVALLQATRINTTVGNRLFLFSLIYRGMFCKDIFFDRLVSPPPEKSPLQTPLTHKHQMKPCPIAAHMVGRVCGSHSSGCGWAQHSPGPGEVDPSAFRAGSGLNRCTAGIHPIITQETETKRKLKEWKDTTKILERKRRQ